MSSTSAARSVSYQCPACHQRVQVESLGKHASIANAEGPWEPTLTGTLWTLVTGDYSSHPPLDAHTEQARCPQCAAEFPCHDVVDLRGELLWHCPCCSHSMLTPSLKVEEVISCPKCGRGYTAGMIVDSKGTFVGPMPVASEHQIGEQERGSVEVRVKCFQTTHFFEYGSGKNEVSEEAVFKLHRLRLVELPEGIDAYDYVCPGCGRPVKASLTSIVERNRELDKTAAWAQTILWIILGVWLVGVSYLGFRGWQGAFNPGVPVPLYDIAVFGVLLLSLFGAFFAGAWLMPGTRTQELSLARRVKIECEGPGSPLWQRTGMYTKGARLEVTHPFEIVEPAAGKP